MQVCVIEFNLTQHYLKIKQNSLNHYILNVRATLPNGNHVYGPVTTKYYVTYHFYNYINNSDFFIIMKKG